jgi:hypothetical protein
MNWKKLILKPNESKMNHLHNVSEARMQYLENPFNNLTFLLKKRYKWMEGFIKTDPTIELGSGAGFSQLFIKNKIFMTDFTKNEWIEDTIDLNNISDSSISGQQIIISHTIHHLANPYKFLKDIGKKLESGQFLIIQEIYTSIFCKILLYLKKHEGWDETKNIYDISEIMNDIHDPWSANCSIPKLLFDDQIEFENKISDFKIIHKKYSEVLILPLSGGVTAKTKMPELPNGILKLIDNLTHF